MAKPIITIIGLGLVGASMGLGLQRETGNFEIVGHDRQPEIAQEARKMGAVQRTEWNIFNACEGAELILLAVPLPELEALLPLLAEEVKPGTLILAIGNLLQPAIASANRFLPAGVHFVAGHAIVTGSGTTANARGDLFESAVFALAAGVNTDADALQLASDFVERVGATPLFVDSLEHDGVIAGVEQLPMLLAAAMMRFSSHGAGWREARRLAGHHFASATEVGGDAAALYAALQANRTSVLMKLESLRHELAQWQELLEEDVPTTTAADNNGTAIPGAKSAEAKRGDKKGAEEKSAEEKVPALLAALTDAVQARQGWEAQSVLKNWEEQAPAPGGSESTGFLKQMFLGGLGNRQRKGK